MILKKVLFQKVREICSSGWHDLPATGTGAPGDFLERFVGLNTSNHDGPDAGLWELKFSRGSSLLTLFHKTPRPKGSIEKIIKQFGWTGSNGLRSFRHTIEGGKSSRDFSAVYEEGAIWIRHAALTETIPHWTENDLLNAAGGKLRRLILVEGVVSKGRVKYEYAKAFQEFKLSSLMEAISGGLVLVDFDAYIKGNGTVRDHGTKFRVRPDNLKHLYEIHEQL